MADARLDWEKVTIISNQRNSMGVRFYTVKPVFSKAFMLKISNKGAKIYRLIEARRALASAPAETGQDGGGA